MEALVVGKIADKVLDDPSGTASWSFDYAGGFIQGFQNLFGGADEFKDRHRTLQLTFANATKHDIILDENDFDSGTWFHSFPVRIKAGEIVIGFVANSQGSFATGVSGGLGLRIEGTNVCVGLGFTNPHWGSYKMNAILQASKGAGRTAYDNSHDNSPKINSLDGFEVQARQVPSKQAMMGYVYTLTQN